MFTGILSKSVSQRNSSPECSTFQTTATNKSGSGKQTRHDETFNVLTSKLLQFTSHRGPLT